MLRSAGLRPAGGAPLLFLIHNKASIVRNNTYTSDLATKSTTSHRNIWDLRISAFFFNSKVQCDKNLPFVTENCRCIKRVAFTFNSIKHINIVVRSRHYVFPVV